MNCYFYTLLRGLRLWYLTKHSFSWCIYISYPGPEMTSCLPGRHPQCPVSTLSPSLHIHIRIVSRSDARSRPRHNRSGWWFQKKLVTLHRKHLPRLTTFIFFLSSSFGLKPWSHGWLDLQSWQSLLNLENTYSGHVSAENLVRFKTSLVSSIVKVPWLRICNYCPDCAFIRQWIQYFLN